MKGHLSEGALPSLLRALYVGRRTGVLQFERDGAVRSVRFRHGHILNAGSSVADERMGEVLVRHGRLTQADLERAAAHMKEAGTRLGEALEALGLLTRERLQEAIALHAREVMMAAFSWPDAEYAFEDEPESAWTSDMSLGLSTGEVILETVRSIRNPEVVHASLGNTERLLALSNDPLLRFQQVTLTPADGYVLSRVDGTTSGRQILEMIPLPQEDVEKSLYGLLCTGIIEYLPGIPGKKAAREAPRAPDPSPPRVASDVPPPPSETATTGRFIRSAAPGLAPPAAPSARPIAPAGPPAPPAPDPAEERRKEILEAYEGLRTRNHFEVLGIPRASSEAQVKEAYFALARRYHPDAHHGPQLAALRSQLEAVFIRIGQAYEVLRNPRSRALYEEDLAARAPRKRFEAQAEAPPGGPAAPSGSGAEQAGSAAPDPWQDAKRATEALRRAERLVADGKFWDAIQLLESAMEYLEGKPRQRARVMLALAYAKNKNWTKKAETVLKEAIAAEPTHAEAMVALAKIYAEGGLKNRAVALYRRILELKPEHEEALAALFVLAPPSEEEPDPGGGFLKRLFRK